MLKNKSLQVRMVNDAKTPGEISERTSLDVEQLNRIVKEQVQNAAIAFGAVMIARKVVDTLGTIAIIVANEKIR